MLDFNHLINLYLKRDFRKKEIGKYYPSEAGNCLRKLYYSYTIPKPTEDDLLKIFHVGNILHEFVLQVLKSEKTPEVKLLQSEVPVKILMEKFQISGRVDDLIMINASGQAFLVEAKSVAMLEMIKKPQPHHIMQLQFYMHASGVHNGMILYLDKRNLKSKVFDIPYDQGIADQAIARFAILHDHLTEKRIPEAEARKIREMQWMCKRCEFYEECYKETPAQKEFPLIERETTL